MADEHDHHPAGHGHDPADGAPDTVASPSGAARGVRGVVPPDDSCAVAHGEASAATARSAGVPVGPAERTLVAVFATPVAGFLLRYGADAGFRGLLVEPDEARAAGARMSGFEVRKAVP
ncbi:MAG TPA: hypothetical protein VI365_03340, partial [Trebonia sp.]